MRLTRPSALALAGLLTSSWLTSVLAEPVQFCKFNSGPTPESGVDFCMGAQMHQNSTSQLHDMFLTMTVRRHGGSSRGWTAIGPGDAMRGALMFIIYGDPTSQEAPIFSIRTAKGHDQPALLAHSDLPEGMDLRVVSSMWLAETSDLSQHNIQDPLSYMARISVICYSCELWRGSDISAMSRSQPWLWAWNPDMEFDTFSFDAHLKMHNHHTEAGGWGKFYVDMYRTISTSPYPPSWPPIRSDIAALGTSEIRMHLSNPVIRFLTGPASYIHGLVLGTAFLILFPLGVISLRVDSPRSHTYHWTLQLTASVMLLIGLGLGISKSKEVNTAHQYLGITIASVVCIQGLFGYWHYTQSPRSRRRTWVAHTHLWIGRAIMLGGWCNVVSGLLLRGYKKTSIVVISMAALVLIESMGLAGWVWLVQNRKERQVRYTAANPSWASEEDTAFTLAVDSDDEEDEAGRRDRYDPASEGRVQGSDQSTRDSLSSVDEK